MNAIVDFMGGLGNQMFQYAFYKSIKDKGVEVKASLQFFDYFTAHNGFELTNVFNVDVAATQSGKIIPTFLPYAFRVSQILSTLKGNKIVREKLSDFFTFCNDYIGNYINTNKSIRYIGYWQNEGYFKDIENQLRKDFEFDLSKVSPKNIALLNANQGVETVSVHVRRGDYLDKNLSGDLGGVCSVDYYVNSMNYFKSKNNAVRFMFFSNDIDWCKKQFAIENSVFIDWNSNSNSWQDLFLMSNCKHNIIANSSFSWWAAWLNANENKEIIAPKKWDNNKIGCDICLDSWFKL